MTFKINTEKSRNVYQEAIKMHFNMCVIICSSRFNLTLCFLLQIFLESFTSTPLSPTPPACKIIIYLLVS